MHRTHTCGELRLADVGKEVTLCGWVRRVRDKGALLWIDLRDRYGFTQLFLEEEKSGAELTAKARELGREFVVKASGKVIERSSKNPDIPTGDIEIFVESIEILNTSKLPPFLIEEETDGGEDIRMKFRYLDLRRSPLQRNLMLRHKTAKAVRDYLDAQGFLEIETPVLIKSTPEGARDFVVPSRMHEGEFYALPQSPQILKQLLMVSGYDRYFQIVKCFRDEDLRADRQPEFTQIDCEMSFVTQEDIMDMFEGLTRHILKEVRGIETEKFPRMTYEEAMRKYGSDKPDLRFGMPFIELNEYAKDKGFKVFDDAELVVGITATGCAGYSRKQLDKLTSFVKKPQVGAQGLVYVKCNEDGSFKSSVDKFFSEEDFKTWMEAADAKPGDLLLILAGKASKTRKAMNELRLEMGNRLELRPKDAFSPLWVVDFPMFEQDEETGELFAMHHPFTSPEKEDFEKMKTDPLSVRSAAYDLVLNGVELGGGSIRIHDKEVQQLVFQALDFTEEEAKEQFGFLMEALEYGAPPHGGIAFGLDRICAVLSGQDSIRDFIAFPKNNAGRDVMMDSPAKVADAQLEELSLEVKNIEG